MKQKNRSGWFWVPSLYYAEGIPYIVVMTVSVIFYKRMGISNTDIALYTSWLYLPWVIKPLWSPVVDILRTKRLWIVVMQLIIGAGLGGVALTIPLPDFFKFTLAFFWLLAFSSATHDIAADGFYMLGLSQHDQAWFVGVRSTFYRLAMMTGQGLLIILAGFLENATGLNQVEVEVQTTISQNQIDFIHPDSIIKNLDDSKLEIIVNEPTLFVPIVSRSKSEIDSIKKFVKNWNFEHEFAVPDKPAEQGKKEESSWFGANLVKPLERFIQDNFGEEKILAKSEVGGNVGLMYLYLSKTPLEEEVVVNISRSSGDKSIHLPDEAGLGSRLVFNQKNWQKPAIALIEIDPKLKTVTQATFETQSGNIPLAWSITFFIMAGLFVVFFVYHKFILPYPDSDRPAIIEKSKGFIKEFADTFILFFKKDKIGIILSFLLLYRLAESQLVKLASPFLLDTQEVGGLGLTTGEVGFVYGTIGLIFLTIGGLLGGFYAAKHGLKYWLWPMALAINIPDAVYIYLSQTIPDDFLIINICVAIEQFGYGFGFTAYMLYMIYVSEGQHKTAHFAITTAFMALGMMIPGMWSGWLQELVGYKNFFIWIMIATIPGFIILNFIPLSKEFGKKTVNPK